MAEPGTPQSGALWGRGDHPRRGVTPHRDGNGEGHPSAKGRLAPLVILEREPEWPILASGKNRLNPQNHSADAGGFLPVRVSVVSLFRRTHAERVQMLRVEPEQPIPELGIRHIHSYSLLSLSSFPCE